MRIFVVDTSYLTELYSVPGFSESGFRKVLETRMRQDRDAQFVVPIRCLYKLCDHIADVPDGRERHRLAKKVGDHVEASVAKGRPWLIVPVDGLLTDLVKEIRTFAANPHSLQMGFTNAQTANVAKTWKEMYAALPNYSVHIWTRNWKLKALEPDPEPNPLM